MSSTSDYDPNEELPSPSMEVLNQILNSPSLLDFTIDTVPTPAGINPSNRNSSSSPPQSTTLSEIFPFDDMPNDIDVTEFSCNYLGTTLPNNDDFKETLIDVDSGFFLPVNDIIYDRPLEIEDEKLCIIAQPKALYRERYSCEIDPNKHRAQRYIRTEDNNSKYEYPTVKIPLKWSDPTRKLYIQVTPVTIKSKNAPQHCIHPYEIDTQENNVIKDPKNNSLYFRIEKNEFQKGEKSFHISRKKMVQNELKSYGSLRLYGSNQLDNQRIQNLQSAKQKIAAYQLWKSQLVFTIAERCNNEHLPVPILHTSVYSQIMTDVETDGRNSAAYHSTVISTELIKCIPQKGDWQGGDEVLIIMPYPIKQKVYNISFDFGRYGQLPAHEITPIDRKTILFRTPSCPWLPGDENLKASIIITENNSVFYPIDFNYITPIRITISVCSSCQGNMMNNHISNKRRCEHDNGFQQDGGEHLVSQMHGLSLEQKISTSHSRMSSDESYSKLDKYLNQLRDALAIFLRTNDPSRLFRRTRVLLSDCNENQPPLNDAIEHGHTQTALSLIEQIMDMPPSNGLLEKANENGETPLLVAAKCNQWKLIKPILEKRCELTKQKDKDENNLLHLLANMEEDKGAETIENVVKMLPDDTKRELVKQKNKMEKTPLEVAQSHGNTQCIDLLDFPIDTGEINA